MLSVYFLTLVLVLPVLIITEKKSNSLRRSNNLAILYTIIVFLLIMGLRDNATISILNGRQSDEYNYRRAFELLTGTDFTLYNVKSFEWVRYIIDWILANTFKNSQVWVFVYAFITNVLFVKAIKKYIK